MCRLGLLAVLLPLALSAGGASCTSGEQRPIEPDSKRAIRQGTISTPAVIVIEGQKYVPSYVGFRPFPEVGRPTEPCGPQPRPAPTAVATSVRPRQSFRLVTNDEMRAVSLYGLTAATGPRMRPGDCLRRIAMGRQVDKAGRRWRFELPASIDFSAVRFEGGMLDPTGVQILDQSVVPQG